MARPLAAIPCSMFLWLSAINLLKEIDGQLFFQLVQPYQLKVRADIYPLPQQRYSKTESKLWGRINR